MIRKQTFNRLCRERKVPVHSTLTDLVRNGEPWVGMVSPENRDYFLRLLIEALLMYQYAWHKERWRGWFDDQ